MHQGKSAPAPKKPSQPMTSRREEAARRMLNLLFTLSVAVEPLTTDQIINDPEIGYTSPERDSRIKAFNRDRETLASLGVFIREIGGRAHAKNEQRLWEIDRHATHANADELSPYDAEEAVRAIDQLFSLHADNPAHWPLQMARAKLRELAGMAPDSPDDEESSPSRDLGDLWSAFSRRKPALFRYRGAQGTTRDRKVDLYGIFEQGIHIYLVGYDRDAQGFRTFRTDRVVSTKPSPNSAPSYRIPKEFDAAGFQFLPFDFSDDKPVQARFAFKSGIGIHEIELVTKGRGTVEEQTDGSHTWTIDIRDLKAAARFTLERTHVGLTALGPDELIQQIHDLKHRAVTAHALQD